MNGFRICVFVCLSMYIFAFVLISHCKSVYGFYFPSAFCFCYARMANTIGKQWKTATITTSHKRYIYIRALE